MAFSKNICWYLIWIYYVSCECYHGYTENVLYTYMRKSFINGKIFKLFLLCISKWNLLLLCCGKTYNIRIRFFHNCIEIYITIQSHLFLKKLCCALSSTLYIYTFFWLNTLEFITQDSFLSVISIKNWSQFKIWFFKVFQRKFYDLLYYGNSIFKLTICWDL